MKIKADEWFSHKGNYKFPIPDHATVHMHVAAAGSIVLVAYLDKHSTIIKASTDGLYFRANLEGYTHLEVQAKEFGAVVEINGRELGEHFDDKLPPARKVPNNLIGKMQAKLREGLAVRREEALSGYEMADDEPVQFEEEEAQELLDKHQQQQKDKIEDASVDDEGDPDDPGPDPGNS